MAENSEHFWNDSKIKGFSFNDDETNYDSVLGVSISGATELSKQIRAGVMLETLDVNSQSTYGQVGQAKGRPKYELLQLISEKSLNAVLESDNLEPCPLQTLEPGEELNLLRRQVQSRWHPPDIDSTIRRIFLGQPYSLELFQTLQNKKDLMKAAISFGDGDAILEVAIFLSRTLKKSLFQQIMFVFPEAVKHYSNYLTTRMQIQEVTDLLEMMGLNMDAAMKQYSLASSNPQRKIAKLKSCSMKYFFDSKDKIFVDNFIRLIEWQMEHTKDAVGRSVKETLTILYEAHCNNEANNLHLILLKEQAVSDKVFQSVSFTTRATRSDWDGIQSMFITKGWFGGKKVKSALSMEQLIIQLYHYKAPASLLKVYLELLDDLDVRLNLAKKLSCHIVVIDVYALLKDRASLLDYINNLKQGTDEYKHAQNILTQAVRWKN